MILTRSCVGLPCHGLSRCGELARRRVTGAALRVGIPNGCSTLSLTGHERRANLDDCVRALPTLCACPKYQRDLFVPTVFAR
jgi:hypothetical protein